MAEALAKSNGHNYRHRSNAYKMHHNLCAVGIWSIRRGT